MFTFAVALCILAAALAAAAPRGEEMWGFLRNLCLIIAGLLTLVAVGAVAGQFLRGAVFG